MFHPKPPAPSLPKPYSISESPPNDAPLPEMLKATTTGYLNCLQETDAWF